MNEYFDLADKDSFGVVCTGEAVFPRCLGADEYVFHFVKPTWLYSHWCIQFYAGHNAHCNCLPSPTEWYENASMMRVFASDLKAFLSSGDDLRWVWGSIPDDWRSSVDYLQKHLVNTYGE